MKKFTRKGFTLIELLVVIAIIGVLASIVLASLNTARAKSRDARRISDVKQLQLALELYFDGAGTGQYPAANGNCTVADHQGLNVLVTNNYISSIPTDPNSAALCYRYATPAAAGTRTTYHLGATLETINPALSSDGDVAYVAAWTNDFDGTSPVAAGAQCGTAAGADNCYDVRP